MRKPLIAGNWKMNTTASEAVQLAGDIAKQAPEHADVDLLVCPPSVYLQAVRAAIGGAKVATGAQNMYHEAKGAYTGEISAEMLTDVGCQFVILGHSERRHILGETDSEVNQKTLAALAAKLTPIVCVGELLQQREANETAEVIRRQFECSLAGLSADQMRATVIAYEPVWAIGTGKVATPEQAEQVHADLRKLIADRYNADVAGVVRLLYGGSVKPDNASQLLGQPNVDGALIGGASLKADDFLAIASAGQAVATA
jgi:triosephosphate isomerase